MKTIVKILRNDRPFSAGKLADAEVHFIGGDLDGLKLIGFGVWTRRDGNGHSVTFPARPFVVHGERKHFALLRAVDDPAPKTGSDSWCSRHTRHPSTSRLAPCRSPRKPGRRARCGVRNLNSSSLLRWHVGGHMQTRKRPSSGTCRWDELSAMWGMSDDFVRRLFV